MRRIRSNNKFWWFAGLTMLFTLLVVISLGVVFWYEVDPHQKQVLAQIIREYFAYFFIAIFFLIAAVFIGLDAIFHNYIIPISKITEQTAIIATVNSSFRIKLDGSQDIQRLAEIINLGAERYEMVRRDTNARIGKAKAELEAEKNVLAGFIGGLPQGVLVCNQEGRILLYNRQARNLLTPMGDDPEHGDANGEARGGYIGLGRSINNILDRNLLQHAQEELEQKLAEPGSLAVAQFLVVGHGGNFINAEMAPILDAEEHLNGFILVLQNITAQLKSKQQITLNIQKFTTLMRASVAGIRSAIESIIDYPAIEPSDRKRFQEIIHQETLAIGDNLDNYIPRITPRSISRWPLIPVKGDYLVAAVLQQALDRLNIDITIKHCDDQTWVKIESYSMVFAVLYILDHLRTVTGNDAYIIELIGEQDFVVFEITWPGRPLKLETLRSWKEATLSMGAETLGLTLGDILQNHGAELWTYRDRGEPSHNYLRFYLPHYNPERSQDQFKPAGQILAGRPEFYDFDLFNQAGQNAEIDDRPLTELTYTVFDTETTGLNPAEGDRIISIGAMRIVNGRLLRDEIFDQLIDPQRSIPQESIEIHGIRPEMLKGMPTIETALPRFHQFVTDTVLIAHNAAFDMRMLQMAEASTGIRFINPVLDTLLLSAVIHPAHRSHSINQIAQRLGVEVTQRHTAAGDALTTGEMFLKMIPLLAAKGIATLGEARAAARKTYYARLKY